MGTKRQHHRGESHQEHAQLAIGDAKAHATPAEKRTIARAIEEKFPNLTAQCEGLTREESK